MIQSNTPTETTPTENTAIQPRLTPWTAISRAEIVESIKRAIDAIDPTDAAVPILPIHLFIQAIMADFREVKKIGEAKFMETIEAQGDIQTGTERWYCGGDKKHKAISNGKVIEAILDATGGDFERVGECLASDPWKRSQIEVYVGPEKLAELFETTVVMDLKTGKPKKGLKVFDERFA